MKKIFIIAAVFAAMTFTGCGNSQKQDAGDTDSTNVEATANGITSSEVKTAIDNMTAQLDAVGGVIDKQQEDAARFCSMLALKREKRVASGDKEDIQVAKDLDKMIRDNLTDCNMRKRDILPTQKQRPDGFVDALKRKTGLGPDMTQEQVLEVIYKWLKKKKYPMTTDAADHMLLSILKTMAKNDDLPEPVDLSEDMLCSNFGSEFADEPNELEDQAYAYLGAVRGRFYDNSDGGDD